MRKGTEKTYLILHGWESSHAAMQYQICLLYTFSHLRKRSADSNTFRLFNKVKPCLVRLVLGWVTKYEHPVLQ